MQRFELFPRHLAVFLPTASLHCFLLTSLLVSAQPASRSNVVTLIDSHTVGVRAAPEILPDNILAQVTKGTQLALAEEKGDWYRVTLPDGREGWVQKRYGRVEAPRDQLEVIGDLVRVRSDPTTDSKTLVLAVQGERMHLLENVGGWYRVEVPNEAEGWVREDLLSPRLRGQEPAEEPNPVTAQIEHQASPSRAAEIVNRDGLQPEANTAEGERTPVTESVDAGEPDREGASDSPQVVGTSEPPLPVPKEEFPENLETPAETHDILSEVGADWLTMTALAGLLVLVVSMFIAIFRNRRLPKTHGTRKAHVDPAKLESKLMREIDEARARLDSLEEEAKNRLTDFRSVSGGGAEARGSKTSDDLLSSLEEMKELIREQQKRLDLYSELVSLQNEQIEAYKKETDSIRKLMEITSTDRRKR